MPKEALVFDGEGKGFGYHKGSNTLIRLQTVRALWLC